MYKHMRSKLTGVVFPYHKQRQEANSDLYEILVEDAVTPDPPKALQKKGKRASTVEKVMGDLDDVVDR